MQIVGQQLERYLDIEVELQPQEVGALFEQLGAGDYDLAVQGAGVPILDPSTMFSTMYTEGAGQNYGGWQNARINEINRLHLNTGDLAERQALVREAEDILINQDSAWAAIDWPRRPYVHHVSIKNFHLPGGITDDLMWEHIWCEPSCGG